jgi:arylsulfatase A-like enzyme
MSKPRAGAGTGGSCLKAPRSIARHSLFPLAGLLLATALALACGGCARRPDPASIHAVFLIVVDTLRPDRLSCYGYQGHRTPAIDGLARRGVRFERVQSAASWTIPSMGALLTSRYPTQLGLFENPPAQPRHWGPREHRPQFRHMPPRGVPTMAELLDDAGFHPAAFVNQPLLNREDGYLRGFAEWCYTVGEDSVVWHDPSTPIPSLELPPGTDLGQADSLLVETFAAWLARKADLRPFVWLHLLKPHWPYAPQPRYLPEGATQDTLTPAEVFYLAEVRETDDLIARVLAAIDAKVGLDHSLVIFTSDHGEEFGDHGMYEHGHSLHREVVQVPLVIAGPGVPAGRVVQRDSRLIDLLPTMLALVGASDKLPRGAEGVSLVPFDERAGAPPVYQEGMFYGSTERSLTVGNLKVMFDEQGEPPYRLFDIKADPDEYNDLGAREKEQLTRMRTALVDFHKRLATDFETLVGLDSLKRDPETQRVLRAMRALGYVGD